MKAIFTLLTVLLLWSTPFWAFAQISDHTVGVLTYYPEQADEGYNLFYHHNQPNVYLLDNCGQIVQEWPDSNIYRPGNTAYLREDGSLVKTKRFFNGTLSPIWAGGGGETVEILSWENELLWSFTQNDASARLHHDIAPMPNGNILMIAWELKTEAEAIQAGRAPESMDQAKLWPDYILEVDPVADSIVWEWHVWDHLIQDFDATKDNFGLVADHPELVDINYQTNNGHPDWMHTNAIDYNPRLDQIIISVPQFDEVWIIDHSTTSEEAASHSGGQAAKGGDLLYRWGNPLAYRAGTSEDQQLFFQHDISWVDDFLSEDDPYFGQLSVFNNRVGPDESNANIFDPGFDQDTWSYTLSEGTFLPDDFTKVIKHPEAGRIFSAGLSSMQVLPNGNFLVCAGRQGYTFEMTPGDEIIWEYITPSNGTTIVDQGTAADLINNATFRAKRYPLNYAAFQGRDLSPQGYLEGKPDVDFCDQLLDVAGVETPIPLQIFPNPARSMVQLQWGSAESLQIEIMDGLGRPKIAQETREGLLEINTENWPSGLYLVRINGRVSGKLMVIR